MLIAWWVWVRTQSLLQRDPRLAGIMSPLLAAIKAYRSATVMPTHDDDGGAGVDADDRDSSGSESKGDDIPSRATTPESMFDPDEPLADPLATGRHHIVAKLLPVSAVPPSWLWCGVEDEVTHSLAVDERGHLGELLRWLRLSATLQMSQAQTEEKKRARKAKAAHRQWVRNSQLEPGVNDINSAEPPSSKTSSGATAPQFGARGANSIRNMVADILSDLHVNPLAPKAGDAALGVDDDDGSPEWCVRCVCVNGRVAVVVLNSNLGFGPAGTIVGVCSTWI